MLRFYLTTDSLFFPISLIWTRLSPWIHFLDCPDCRLNRPRRPQADIFYRLLLFTMFKNSSRSLFLYPTLGGLKRWSRQIFSPRRYRVVLDSACRFPTIFAKMRPINPKKGSGTIGTQTTLGEMEALLIEVIINNR